MRYAIARKSSSHPQIPHLPRQAVL
jgi:hypothetical protein